MKVELHIIQNFAPACLNRDDVNAPKDCEFGGFRRARISSQCLKRAIRMHWNENGMLEGNRAKRTRLLVEFVTRHLVEQGRDRESAVLVARTALEAGTKLSLKDDGTTEYLLFLGEGAIADFARAVDANWDELLSLAETAAGSEEQGKGRKKGKSKTLSVPPAVAEAAKVLFDGTKAADLALFGRMIADMPDKNIEASCQVAHAISTHAVTMEMDYFTAVDDLQPSEDTGAGMIGTTEFNSACYYRYSVVDFDQLVSNLGGDTSLALRTLEAYLVSSAEAIPSGKQNSMAAHNPPSLIFAVVRRSGAPWSLVNAFEHPVHPNRSPGGGLVRQSIERLDAYWGR
ncbi:MAG TPA: type I-E CRISPR-associated protein Cas7/Cse4/CasC, partial [Clostridiales bacterium]|nr:type I-E CRISPR-associated protein Cas7/Cse4/CasC [Clostridiales bacterium]